MHAKIIFLQVGTIRNQLSLIATELPMFVKVTPLFAAKACFLKNATFLASALANLEQTQRHTTFTVDRSMFQD